jgi:pimeloyl-ACP methyl ester carboxylesterase
MGDDPTPVAEVTLALWAERIAALARGAGEQVILVGHSRGGTVIGEAAERDPDAVLGLVYVTALLLPAGTNPLHYLAAETPHLMTGVSVTPDGLATTYDPAMARQVFYGRVSPADADWAVALLSPEPIAPNREALTITEARWGRLPRAYVECLDDRALPIAVQRQMHAVLPCDPVVSIDSDHSPFLSAPEELARHLGVIAAGFERVKSALSP